MYTPNNSMSYPETPNQNEEEEEEKEKEKIKEIVEQLRLGNEGKIDPGVLEELVQKIQEANDEYKVNKLSTPGRIALGNSMLEKVVNENGDTEVKIIPQYNKIFTGSGTYIMWCAELDFKPGRKEQVMRRWQNFFTKYPFWCPHALRMYETGWSPQEVKDVDDGNIVAVKDFKDDDNIRFYVRKPKHLYKGGEAKTSALMRYYDGLENSTCSSLTPEENLWTFATFFGTGGVNGKINALAVETKFFAHKRIHDHLIPRMNEGGGTGISYTEMVFDLQYTEMKKVMIECQQEIVGQNYMGTLSTNVLGRRFARNYNLVYDIQSYKIVTNWNGPPTAEDTALANKLWKEMGEDNMKKMCPNIYSKKIVNNSDKSLRIVEFFANIYKYKQGQLSYFEAEEDMTYIYEVELENLFSTTGYSKANEEANKKYWRVNFDVVVKDVNNNGIYAKSSRRNASGLEVNGHEGDTEILYYKTDGTNEGYLSNQDVSTELKKIATWKEDWGCWVISKYNREAILDQQRHTTNGRSVDYIKIEPKYSLGQQAQAQGIYLQAEILEELFEIRTEVIDIPDLDNANEMAILKTGQVSQNQMDNSDLQTILRVRRQADLFREWKEKASEKEIQKVEDEYASLGEEGTNMLRSTMPPDYRDKMDLAEQQADMIRQAMRNDISELKSLWKKLQGYGMNDDMKAMISTSFDKIDKTITRAPPETDGKPNAKSPRTNDRKKAGNSSGYMMMTNNGSENNPIVLDDDVNMKNGDTEKEFSKLKIRF